MKYFYFLSILALTIQAACASEDGPSSPGGSANAGGAGSSAAGGPSSNAAGSSSTGRTGSISVVAAGLPDQDAATALTQHSCYVGLKITGVTYSRANCGASSTTSSVAAFGPKSLDDFRLGIDIALNNPPAIGKLDLASLTIRIPNGDDTSSYWDAPVDACTASATDSVIDSFMGRSFYSIEISCTQPATPRTDLSLAPLPLNQFAIVTFFTA